MKIHVDMYIYLYVYMYTYIHMCAVHVLYISHLLACESKKNKQAGYFST